MQQPAKARGLVADLWPLLRLMQASGHFIFEYRDGAALAPRLLYSCVQAFVVVVGFATIVINMAFEAGDVNDLSANTITTLFFVHSITKLAYFALRSGKFYRTLATWNQTNSHPLFSESQARCEATTSPRAFRPGSSTNTIIYTNI
ncbi:Odorant receptor coreceptor [Gryllus bimaculatus]|nr:Odorant receptor coreceptor [Gryllus bimaculatus]